MARVSPTAEGFRVLFRRPIVPLAEIAWRWTFAATACFLGGSFVLQYADTLHVNALDRLLLATQQPVLILQAIHRIFEGSALRFTRAGLLLALALTIAWIVLASLGRAATVRSLIEDVTVDAPRKAGSLASLFVLNFFQVAVTLAAVVSAIGSALLASSVWASTHVSVADAVRLWMATLFLTSIAWSVLNWLLSTAAIFAVDEAQGVVEALAAAVRLGVSWPFALAIPGVWFGLIHFGAFLFACSAAFTVLAAGAAIGPAGVLILECLVLLAYSAVVSFARIGRFGAYVSIVYGPADATSVGHTPLPAAPEENTGAVDASELILSDMPLTTT